MNNEMEQKHNITDEQIARFLDGTATEEEKEVILEYMSQSDENVDELMSIADAVQAQRESTQAAKQSNNHAVAWRVAASVAVVLVAGGIWFALRDRGVNLMPQTGNTVAMNTPATPPATTEPGTTVAPEGDGTDVAPTVTTTPTNKHTASTDLVADVSTTSSSDDESSVGKYKSLPGGTMQADLETEMNTASSQMVSDKPTDPPATLRDIHAEVPKEWKSGTDLNISWKCNAPSLELMMKPQGSKRWMYKKEFPFEQSSVAIPARAQKDYTLKTKVIEWRMEAHFPDGRTVEKKGIITVVE